MPEDVLEIVVTAPRIDGASDFQSFPAWVNFYDVFPPAIKGTEWFFGPYPEYVLDKTANNHLKKNVIINSIYTFQQRFDALKANLMFRDPAQIVSLGNGYNLTIESLQQKLLGLQFVIVDKEFAGPGYGGANYGNRIEINWSVFAGYAARDEHRTNYLILHEIAHNTEFGIASRSWSINAYRDGGNIGFYGAGNQFFERQEAYANTIARNIGDAIGVPITSPNDPLFPRFGFVETQ